MCWFFKFITVHFLGKQKYKKLTRIQIKLLEEMKQRNKFMHFIISSFNTNLLSINFIEVRKDEKTHKNIL